MWYIDSDNVIHIVGLRKAVENTYVNNATITARLYELPALNPDAAAVIDETEGKVGIPCAGHTLKDDETVRLECFKNYTAVYVLQTGTTGTGKLIITATYAAEILKGTEFIYKAIVGTLSVPITFSYIEASNGEYVGKFPYTTLLLQGESYVLCIKEVSGGEQVLAKVIYQAGFQGM